MREQIKQVLKNSVYRAIGETARGIGVVNGDDRTLRVLMYHKVNDLPGNRMSMPVSLFDEQMAELRVEGNAGGGMVTVVVNGAKQILSLKIDPEVVSKEDVEMLQDLIVAAINDAQRKADEALTQKMGGLLPPGMNL